MKVNYPTRCRIVNPGGFDYLPGLEAQAPEKSLPHIGKEGLAERTPGGDVMITLDNGGIIFGYECWWEPIEGKD